MPNRIGSSNDRVAASTHLATASEQPADERLISHRRSAQSVDQAVVLARQRIIADGEKTHVSVAAQLSMLDELVTFELGRYLLVHQGLNGYWTHRIVYAHPQRRGSAELNDPARDELERFLLELSPTVLATQERFKHFQRLVQEEIDRRSDEVLTLASVPCGVMADLLTLDYSSRRVELAGFDLDQESLRLASELAHERGLRAHLAREDAWQLSARAHFDVLVSNGLNIYEPDDERVARLYARFGAALKPGGMLVTSFLSPPDEWNTSRIDGDALRRQRVIFADIVAARWQCFRSSALSIQQLKDAGFTDIELIPDHANLFPTVVARWPR